MFSRIIVANAVVAVGRYEVREQARVGLRVERIAQLGHAEEHLEPSCHLVGRQRPGPARVATDEHETRWYCWVALEQRQGDHRPERVAHQVRPLEAERGDEGREGVGELRRSPAVVDVRRLPKPGASQAMTVWSRERSGSIHCHMRLSLGAPCNMTSGGPEPARV